MDGKARLADRAKPLLAALPDSVFRDLMYKRLSELVGINEQKLRGDTIPADQNAVEKRPAATARTNREVRQNATRDAIALLLQHPELAGQVEVPDLFATATIQGFSLLHALYCTVRDNPGISSSALLERWRDNRDFGILQKLMQRNVQGTDEKAGQLAVFRDALQRLVEKYRDERFEALETRLKQNGLSAAELEEYKSLLSR